MKKIFLMTIAGGLLGIAIGFLIALSFTFIYQVPNFTPSAPAFVAQFATSTIATAVSAGLWFLMGVVFTLGSLVYTFEHWSITKQTIVHFIITFGSFTPLAILVGQFPLNVFWLLGYTFVFIAIYSFNWILAR